jgi:hypothetical protein
MPWWKLLTFLSLFLNLCECGSFFLRPTSTHQNRWYTWLLAKFRPRSKPHSIGKTLGHSKHNWTSLRHHWNSPPGCKFLDIIAKATKTMAESRHRGPLMFDSKTGSQTLLMAIRLHGTIVSQTVGGKLRRRSLGTSCLRRRRRQLLRLPPNLTLTRPSRKQSSKTSTTRQQRRSQPLG